MVALRMLLSRMFQERARRALTEVMSRKKGDIGFSAIRGGDIVGEHDVLFAAPGERIVLRHIATDRAIFARGALKAALWGQDQPPGEYDMFDVLDLQHRYPWWEHVLF